MPSDKRGKAEEMRSSTWRAALGHPLHIIEAAKAGADIATVPVKVLELATQHLLTDKGIERFLADWQQFTAETHKTSGIS